MIEIFSREMKGPVVLWNNININANPFHLLSSPTANPFIKFESACKREEGVVKEMYADCK